MKSSSTLVFILTLLTTACAPVDSVRVFDDEQAAKLLQESFTTIPGKQMIALNLPQNEWKRIDLSRGKKTSVIFVPPNEDALNWTQSIQTRAFAYPNNLQINAAQFASGQISVPRMSCAFVQGKIVEQTEKYSLYQVNLNHCTDTSDIIEIGKVFNGIDAVYAVMYLAKIQPSQAELARSTRIIATAELVRVAQPSVPSGS